VGSGKRVRGDEKRKNREIEREKKRERQIATLALLQERLVQLLIDRKRDLRRRF